MKRLALIPARGGSKRIPRKNLSLFDGEPAITRVIKTANSSGLFEKVWVSTDDAEISKCSKYVKASIIKRPKELANDFSDLGAVINHFLGTLKVRYDSFCLILPTAVFITPEILIKACDILEKNANLDNVISIKKYSSPVQRSLKLSKNGMVYPLDKNALLARSQDLDPIYYHDGMLSFTKLEKNKMPKKHSFEGRTFGFDVSNTGSIDIDEPADLQLAQAIFKQNEYCRQKRVLFRCHYDNRSGFGHLKRCIAVSNELSNLNIKSIFLLDYGAKKRPIPFKNDAIFKFLRATDTGEKDAKRTCYEAQAVGTNIVIKDHFLLDGNWDKFVSHADNKIVAFDDLGKSISACLKINYSPDATLRNKDERAKKDLMGVKYFPTDLGRRNKRVKGIEGKNVIFFVGKKKNLNKVSNLFNVVNSMKNEMKWKVKCICTDNAVRANILDRKFVMEEDVLDFQTNINWQDYDIVIGPTSTTLYETILEGVLPITFAISNTQSDRRNNWLSLGHALHICSDELGDINKVSKIFELSEKKYSKLKRILVNSSKHLDGRGARRIANAIKNINVERRTKDFYENRKDNNSLRFRECEIKDAENFRCSRNQSFVRKLSTNPDHIIPWDEHLNWWLDDSTKKFLIERDENAIAFFWHKPKLYNRKKYLIGGWFPASDKLVFKEILQLFSFQQQRTKQDFPGHRWLATINKNNLAVINMNQRFGFKNACEEAKAAAKIFFPTVDEDFLVLEREL